MLDFCVGLDTEFSELVEGSHLYFPKTKFDNVSFLITAINHAGTEDYSTYFELDIVCQCCNNIITVTTQQKKKCLVSDNCAVTS